MDKFTTLFNTMYINLLKFVLFIPNLNYDMLNTSTCHTSQYASGKIIVSNKIKFEQSVTIKLWFKP